MPKLATILRGVALEGPGDRRRVDLGIDRDGRIAALAEAGTLGGAERVDCTRLMALPGGIDPHVHIATYFGGTTTRDDFFSGTRAALFGGTTTIAQFAIPRPGETSLAAVRRTREEADGAAVADHVVHGCIVRETYERSMDELPALAEAGVRTVKIFSAYTDVIGLTPDRIHRLLGRAAATGFTVFVHAETDSLIAEGIAAALERGDLGAHGHAASRAPLAEDDAIHLVTELAADARATVYFVHISSAPSVTTLADLRGRGRAVFAETCPHYLFLDEAVYRGVAGERWICSPPIRTEEHRAALWAGIRSRVIDTVASDHNCFDSTQKAGAADFRGVPNGLPGIEHRVPLLIDAAIRGQLGWERLAELVAEAPARILGIWPRKGSLTVGADADVVLVDPSASTELGPGHMQTDFSPYEGRRVAGRIVRVYRRGTLAVDGDSFLAERGSGTWLPITSGPRAGGSGRGRVG